MTIRTPASVPLVLAILALSSRGRAQSGIFPGPPPSPPPQFVSTLTGAGALPPNDSPFLATAAIDLSRSSSPKGRRGARLLHIIVHFSPETLGNSESTARGPTANIQTKDGTIIRSDSSPLEFPRVYWNPPYPGCDRCPPPPQQVNYEGWFEIGPKQINELLAGKWFVDVPATRADGIEAPAYEIRGQVLANEADRDDAPDGSG